MTIATWNTRGNNPTAFILNVAQQDFPDGPLRNLIPDFICIQEAGNGGWGGHVSPAVACAWNPAPSLGFYEPIAGLTLNHTQYNGYKVPWQATNPGGNERCTLAILWRAALGAHAAMPISGWHDGIATHRPVFWVTPVAGTPRIGCIHAPSGGGAATQLNINGAIAVMQAGAPASGWRLAGDFNFSANLVAVPAGVNVQSSGGATQVHGGNLDYLLHQTAPAYAHCASAGAYVGNSDHLEVRFA